MTAKRHSKSKAKKERPKIKKETLGDLDAKGGQHVRGGRAAQTAAGKAGCSL